MVRYFFWRLAPGGGIAHTASCTVPYSEAALRRVDRHFGVERGGGADQFVVRQAMLTTQSCVEDENTNACVFDPLVVTAPPRENSDPCEARPTECTNKFGSGSENWWSDPNSWSGGGGGADTGGGGDTGLPGDDDDDGDTLDEGPIAYTLCIAIKLGAGGWSAIGGTVVSATLAWDARKNTREAYDAWDGYRRNTMAGIIPYDLSINDLYYKRWKDAEHQEYLLYGALGITGLYAAAEIFQAAVLCSPYAAAPVP
jgi:hypothetical protein